MVFRDRAEAGRLLAERLTGYQGADVMVLALPRGGLPIGRAVADRLGAPLDVIVARKIGAPGHEEYAIGAVSARGHVVLNQEALGLLELPPGYLDAKTREEQAVARQRESLLRGEGTPPVLEGKTVILVDDGIATGMTMQAAILDVQAQGPRQVVVAAPVIAPATFEVLRGQAARVVALELPMYFGAVGAFYEDFHQVTDTEARAVLKGASGAQAGPI